MVTRHRNGYALIVAIAAIALLAAAVLCVGRYLEDRLSEQHHLQRELTLIALSDAAMAQTLADLDRDPGFSGVVDERVGSGIIASSVRRMADGRIAVRAEGRVAGWKSVIEAELESAADGPRVRSWTRRTVPS